MNMIMGICRSFNVNIRISRIRLNISVDAGSNTGIILNIQQIINVSICLGDSMIVNIIRAYVLVFVAASILMHILLLV